MAPVAKLLDDIVSDVSFYVKKVIVDEQHGFVKSRSASSKLFLFTNYIMNSL